MEKRNFQHVSFSIVFVLNIYFSCQGQTIRMNIFKNWLLDYAKFWPEKKFAKNGQKTDENDLKHDLYIFTRVSKFSFNFFCENFVQPTKMLTKTKIFVKFFFAKFAKFVRNFREFRETRSKFSTFRLKSFFFAKIQSSWCEMEKFRFLSNKYFAKMKFFSRNSFEICSKIFDLSFKILFLVGSTFHQLY